MADAVMKTRASNRNDLSAGYVRSILAYDPSNGLLTWKERTDAAPWWNGKWAGEPAGSVTNDGYIRITINGRKYMAHRLAWLITTGAWPEPEADHKNTNRADNRWDNLRQATEMQNRRNRSIGRNNTTGFKGAFWNKEWRRWSSSITADGKNHFLGYFDTAEKAHEAYCAAADRLHGEFAQHSKK